MTPNDPDVDQFIESVYEYVEALALDALDCDATQAMEIAEHTTDTLYEILVEVLNPPEPVEDAW